MGRTPKHTRTHGTATSELRTGWKRVVSAGLPALGQLSLAARIWAARECFVSLGLPSCRKLLGASAIRAYELERIGVWLEQIRFHHLDAGLPPHG